MPEGKITGLLKAWADGDPAAQEHLIPLVYNELRRLASRSRRHAEGSETLRTTALIHEAYLRLVNLGDIEWNDRVHFFAVSAQLMRRILVDAARARHSVKRGGHAAVVDYEDLDEIASLEPGRGAELIALDEAMTRLQAQDPRRCRIVELRVFAGMSVEETAELLGVSPQTVMRDWKLAKAWLLRELSDR